MAEQKRPNLPADLTRRGLLMGLLASAATPALAGAPLVSLRPPAGRGADPAPGAEILVRKAGLSGQVSFAVADAQTGELLESRGDDKQLAPASVAKAITALYALDTLGPSHTFKTSLLATGGVVNGVVQGDLILVGGCDPTTDTRDFAALAATMKDAGIREVRGSFLVYDGLVASVPAIDQEQPDHVGYNPAVSGIALNFNRVHFEWKRAGSDYTVTMDARAGKYRPDVTVSQMKIKARRAPIYTYESREGRDYWTVAKGALGREGARWLPVRNPGLYAGEVFSTFARSHGIVLHKPKLTASLPLGTILASIESPRLDVILKSMLKHSTNLTAEMVGLAATRARIGRTENLAGSAAEMNRWAVETLGMDEPAFVDHSGLGDRSRISAPDMVRGLAAAGRRAALRPLLKAVKLLDAQGRPVNDHPVKADAKTGTLNFVSGLGGYITTPSGRELVFAIFTADFDKRAGIPREARERPPGARTWATRSRRLQRRLIMRWGQVYNVAADG